VTSTVALGIVSIAFALILRAQTHNLPEDAQRLPVLLIWIVIMLGVLMIVEDLLKRRAASRAKAGAASAVAGAADVEPPLPPVNLPVLAIFGAAIIGYVALIPLAGYLLVTPLFVVGGLLASRTLGLAKSLLVGLCATALVWAVFIWALNLPVPLFPAFATAG
jgi:putative tricarboxylic transport membrane protein